MADANKPDKMPDAFMIDAAAARFDRDPADDAHVLMTVDGTTQHVGSVTMAFPLSDRARMVVVRDREGREIGVLDNLSKLHQDSREIVEAEIEKAYFLPRITNVNDIEQDLNLVTWSVETDRGPRTFHVRSVRQNIRRIGRARLVIRDVDGNRYEIPDTRALTPRGRRLVEEYI